MIRSFLRGAFANTAFCILAPDGKTRLSGSGRGPCALFGRRGGPSADTKATIEALESIASKYRRTGEETPSVALDFHSTRQALNVASGDQRLLLLTVAHPSLHRDLSQTIGQVLDDKEVVGRFHHDFAGKENDREWADLMEGATAKTGYFIVRADPFGMEGEVMAQLSLQSSHQELKQALLDANQEFAKTEQRKVYREHVQVGRRLGIQFENGMPYGEDRDGDGVIDKRPGRRRR